MRKGWSSLVQFLFPLADGVNFCNQRWCGKTWDFGNWYPLKGWWYNGGACPAINYHKIDCYIILLTPLALHTHFILVQPYSIIDYQYGSNPVHYSVPGPMTDPLNQYVISVMRWPNLPIRLILDISRVLPFLYQPHVLLPSFGTIWGCPCNFTEG